MEKYIPAKTDIFKPIRPDIDILTLYLDDILYSIYSRRPGDFRYVVFPKLFERYIIKKTLDEHISILYILFSMNKNRRKLKIKNYVNYGRKSKKKIVRHRELFVIPDFSVEEYNLEPGNDEGEWGLLSD